MSPLANPIAIIAGAPIIGGSIVGAQFVDRYEISAPQDFMGTQTVYRINTRTGDIESCSFAQTAATQPFTIECAGSFERIVQRVPVGRLDDSQNPPDQIGPPLVPKR